MKKTLFLTGIVFILFSCNSGNKENSEGASDNGNEAVSSKNKGKSYDCLKKFEEDYEGLLTKEEMASVYPEDYENAKKELRSGNYGEHIYRWPSNRPGFDMEMSGMKIKIPDNNTIGIKTFSFSTSKADQKSRTETFNMGYKELSDKELAQIQANLEKQSEEIKKTGKDMMKVRGKRNWDFVDNLGTSAWYKWGEKYGGELAVLAGRSKFYIVIKVSEDPAENRDLAIKLAEKVLAKCN